jgi:hypothetical protein
MRKVVAEKVAGEIAEWGHRGLVDSELIAQLQERYSIDITMGSVLLRWLGFFAVALLAMSVLGLIGMSMGKAAQYLAPFILGALAAGLWIKGTQMASDPLQRFPTSGAVLVTFALFAVFSSLITAYGVFGGDEWRYAVPVLMMVTAATAFFTAYRYGLRWPLILAVLLAFHALGNMHAYGGRGSYFMGIQDERLTLLIAIISIVFGMWHEKHLERDLNRREVGFGQIYIVFGLLYANLSIWFLTIPKGDYPIVLAFAAAAVTQIVLGGRFHDGRFTGFGIVFLAINIYTRMFESFWNEMSKGAFFLMCGVLAMVVGALLEYRARTLRQESSA